MADAMVTSRMTKAKKDAGNRVLESLGLNASQAVNRLYDYLIEEQRLPFETIPTQRPSADQIRDAIAYIDSIPVKNSFSALSDEDIGKRKLESLLGT